MTFRPSTTVYQSKRRNVPEDEFPSYFLATEQNFVRQNFSIPLPDSVIILVSDVATGLRAGRSHYKGLTSA